MMDTVEIIQDLVVPQPENAIALVLQELGSLGFPVRQVIVLATIDLHDQSRIMTNKIGNVSADQHLAAELLRFYLTQAQYMPDLLLCLGHIPSQSARGYARPERVFLHFPICAAGASPPPNPPPSRWRAPSRTRCTTS